MPKKLIGITGPSTFSNVLMRAVEKCLDANFVLLYHNNEENLEDWVSQVDGIIFAGGADIHPTCYGRNVSNHSSLSNFDLARDRREFFVLSKALEKKLPILGICRGHQLLGVAHGMHLIQDISSSSVAHSPSKSGITLDEDEPAHFIKILKRSMEHFKATYKVEKDESRKLLGVFANDGENKYWVNSFHHQAIYHVPPKKEPSQEEAEEGVPDANDICVIGISNIDVEKKKFIVEFMDNQVNNWISVQWHPENDWESNPISKSIFIRFNEIVNEWVNKKEQLF